MITPGRKKIPEMRLTKEKPLARKIGQRHVPEAGEGGGDQFCQMLQRSNKRKS